jgi:hypothetical protein
VPLVTAIPVRKYGPAPCLLSDHAMEVVIPHMHRRTRLASGPNRKAPSPRAANRAANRARPGHVSSLRYLTLASEIAGAALLLYLLGLLEVLVTA